MPLPDASPSRVFAYLLFVEESTPFEIRNAITSRHNIDLCFDQVNALSKEVLHSLHVLHSCGKVQYESTPLNIFTFIRIDPKAREPGRFYSVVSRSDTMQVVQGIAPDAHVYTSIFDRFPAQRPIQAEHIRIPHTPIRHYYTIYAPPGFGKTTFLNSHPTSRFHRATDEPSDAKFLITDKWSDVKNSRFALLFVPSRSDFVKRVSSKRFPNKDDKLSRSLLHRWYTELKCFVRDLPPQAFSILNQLQLKDRFVSDFSALIAADIWKRGIEYSMLPSQIVSDFATIHIDEAFTLTELPKPNIEVETKPTIPDSPEIESEEDLEENISNLPILDAADKSFWRHFGLPGRVIPKSCFNF